MKKIAKKKKASLAEWLIKDHDIPPELLSGGCFMELRGRHSVIVRGCRRVVRYSTESVMLRIYKNIVEIRGKRLTCMTYLAGTVTVEGLIDSVSFVRGDAPNET